MTCDMDGMNGMNARIKRRKHSESESELEITCWGREWSGVEWVD